MKTKFWVKKAAFIDLSEITVVIQNYKLHTLYCELLIIINLSVKNKIPAKPPFPHRWREVVKYW